VSRENLARGYRRSHPKGVGLIKTELYRSDEVVCEEPLITVDRQMGLNIVHPEGKVNDTFCSQIFNSQGDHLFIADSLQKRCSIAFTMI
jgi:hypothetical protein